VRLAAAELLCGLPQQVTGSSGAERLRGACTALVRSLEQQTDFPTNATRLAHLLLQLGESAGARTWLEHALARDPQFVAGYLRRSELERVAGDQAASARVLEEGLARLPRAAELHYASGLALVRLGKKPEALARLARAVELAPDDSGMVFTYAVALQDQGKTSAAVKVLEDCLHGQPENGELLEAVLRIGLETRDAGVVKRHLPTFERLFPQEPSLALLRGVVGTR
jgi:tetratricopeptide (TPR) repeat protein